MPKLGPDLMAVRVPQARAYLIPIVQRRGLATYKQVMKAIGAGRAYIGQILDELNRREHAAGRPLISAIVVLDCEWP